MLCSHCGVCIGQVRAASCLRLLLLLLLLLLLSRYLPWHSPGIDSGLWALALAMANSRRRRRFFPWHWLQFCAYLVTLCLFPADAAAAPAAISSYTFFLFLFFFLWQRLLRCLIIKMTKYLEKIINFVCMFGKIISCRYKVPFMSCLYLLSPSREHTKTLPRCPLPGCVARLELLGLVAMRHSACLPQRLSWV